MSGFKTPTTKRTRSRVADNPELQTPIKIPASPFLEQIGYGCGVNVYTLERSPKVGFTRSPWAIKKRNRKIPELLKYNQMIRLEADILKKLSHPNIVGFRGFTEESNGEPCLAMEKLDCSLGDMIEERLDEGLDAFPAKNILQVGYEVVKGLEYLHHTAHILHGDMKSFNILVSRNFDRVKICDFGVSVPITASLELDSSKGDFNYVGTECWSAPEIIFEDGPVTNEADIWAYGLVIWEMIALSPPHVEDIEESINECSFDASMSDDHSKSNKGRPNTDDSMDESVMILEEIIKNKYGTRPALPAINLGKEYDKVLELFYACTTADYKVRPSAKGIRKYFEKYVYGV